jgi:hypothetical protein
VSDMSLKQQIRSFLRYRLPVAVVPKWSIEWWQGVPEFTLNAHHYVVFCHTHNCGWPPSRMTERAVEVRLADRWLSHVLGPVIEIGAVTPYYWPSRVARVVDPADGHPLVTDRVSLFDIDTTGLNVLCLSTLEHIGSGEYGQPLDPIGPTKALAHLTANCRDYLITVPFGYNPDIDAAVFGDASPVPAKFLMRSADGNDWRECSAHEARVPPSRRSGKDHFAYANGLAVMAKGCGI